MTEKHEEDIFPDEINKEDYIAATEIISSAFGCCAENELGVDEVHHAFLLSILGVIYYQFDDKKTSEQFVAHVQKVITQMYDEYKLLEGADMADIASLEPQFLETLFTRKTIH